MTSLVPGLGKRQLHFCQLWRDRKIILSAGPDLKFENYELVQHSHQFSGIKKGAKTSFHRHFNLLNHSKQHIAVCGLSLHQGSTGSRKTLEQKFINQLILTVSTNAFRPTNLFCCISRYQAPTNSVAPSFCI